jgi:restriction system protein
LTTPKRGHFQITNRGKELLQSNPDKINVKLLNRYEEFVLFKTAHRTKDIEDIQEEKSDEFGTPEEALEYGYQKIISNLPRAVDTMFIALGWSWVLDKKKERKNQSHFFWK